MFARLEPGGRYRAQRGLWLTPLLLGALAVLVSALALHSDDRDEEIEMRLRSAENAVQALRAQLAIERAARYRSDSTAAQSAAVQTRRLDLVIDAVDAVAKTCPNRFRAPRALEEAKSLKE